MDIILYGTHCNNCKMIETKLNRKNFEFKIIDDPDEVVAFGEKHNIKSMPILVVDDEVFDLKAANNWLKNN